MVLVFVFFAWIAGMWWINREEIKEEVEREREYY